LEFSKPFLCFENYDFQTFARFCLTVKYSLQLVVFGVESNEKMGKSFFAYSLLNDIRKWPGLKFQVMNVQIVCYKILNALICQRYQYQRNGLTLCDEVVQHYNQYSVT